VKRIRGNADALGVPGLTVLHGAAPGALVSLPRPHAVFIGGGASSETLDQSWSALRLGGRLVVIHFGRIIDSCTDWKIPVTGRDGPRAVVAKP